MAVSSGYRGLPSPSPWTAGAAPQHTLALRSTHGLEWGIEGGLARVCKHLHFGYRTESWRTNPSWDGLCPQESGDRQRDVSQDLGKCEGPMCNRCVIGSQLRGQTGLMEVWSAAEDTDGGNVGGGGITLGMQRRAEKRLMEEKCSGAA